MLLTAGTRVGSYEVLTPIGSGGMGEVYRARDTKLDCEVALKVLPELFASDPDRVARFAREAKTLAALNHPNIAAIHGLEESNGVSALVLELVEGPTLADRIAQGPIPLDEALPIARQIAGALDTAHELGIVHRDLKPANIKVRSDAAVKVLDFGLAKMRMNDASPNATLTNSLLGPDQRLMVAAYSVEGDVFRSEQPRLWASARAVARTRGLVGFDGRAFDLHPDGVRAIGAWTLESSPASVQNSVVLAFNFFDELRRLAPPKP